MYTKHVLVYMYNIIIGLNINIVALICLIRDLTCVIFGCF